MDVIVEKLKECGVIGRLPVSIPITTTPAHVPVCEPTDYEPYSHSFDTQTGGNWGERQVTSTMEIETCKINE